jgi:trafficking protein particle complex subunit 10
MQDGSTGSSSKMQPYGRHSREQKLSFAEPKTMIHPSRSSSLNYGRSSSADPPYSHTPSTGQVIYENGQYQDRPIPSQEAAVLQQKTGLQDIAGARAQLHIMQRRILEHVGKSLGWTIGWAVILSSLPQRESFNEVDLDEQDGAEEPQVQAKEALKTTAPTLGLSAAALVNGVSSIDQFRQFYEVDIYSLGY